MDVEGALAHAGNGVRSGGAGQCAFRNPEGGNVPGPPCAALRGGAWADFHIDAGWVLLGDSERIPARPDTVAVLHEWQVVNARASLNDAGKGEGICNSVGSCHLAVVLHAQDHGFGDVVLVVFVDEEVRGGVDKHGPKIDVTCGDLLDGVRLGIGGDDKTQHFLLGWRATLLRNPHADLVRARFAERPRNMHVLRAFSGVRAGGIAAGQAVLRGGLVAAERDPLAAIRRAEWSEGERVILLCLRVCVLTAQSGPNHA